MCRECEAQQSQRPPVAGIIFGIYGGMDHLFNKTAINKIRALLLKKEETIAVAESVTGGLLQAALASADDAIQFFQGGITAYNIGQKARHLLVDPIHAAGCNCVSERVATEMALNVCLLFKSAWGIGVTGYASAVPESDNEVYCYYAIAYKGKVVKKGRIKPAADTAQEVQMKYVNTILKAFAK